MTKELFIKSICSLQAVEDFQRGVLNLLRTTAPYADMGIMQYPDCSDTLISVLEDAMGDDEGWITYFCYERDFGRDHTLGDVTIDGNPIPFSTAEDLYNLLNKQRRKLTCPSTE